MATAVSIEAPVWATTRANTYRAKQMDESALVPFEHLSVDDQKRQKGRWIAYTFTLDDPKRAYVYGAAVDIVSKHAQGYESYSLADLGAGNGKNTIKTATALRAINPRVSSAIYLVEQSGAALNEANKLFRRSGSDHSTKFLQEDITETTIPDRSMDAVTIVNVWHHLPSWEKLQASATEIDRILKPGGLFVVVDTRPLPPTGLKRKIIEGKIRGAVRYEDFLDRAAAEGMALDGATILGMKDFCEHDAFKAFENALTKEQFKETLRRSALAPSLKQVTDLRSSHPLLKHIYPPLNLAWGIKR